MIFIILGEIVVSHLEFDREKETFVDEPLNLLSAGDFFGQVSLIYNQNRNATCKTQSMYT